MTFWDVLRAAFGLILTLGLVGLAAYAARRLGPPGLLQTKPASQRRMAVIETLSLAPTARLVLVKVDGGERLVLVGEGAVHPVSETRPRA